MRPLARVCVGVDIRGQACALIACSLTYSAFHEQPPYFLRLLWSHHIFRHYPINGAIFGKKVIEHKMCVSISSTTFV
jgi:hypothetical protein